MSKLHIKQIVDKILKKSDVSAQSYSVAERIDDINSEYLLRIEQAVQIGSTEPISNQETFTEEFTTVDGSQDFERTIKDIPITRVDFKHASASHFERVTKDFSRQVDSYRVGNQKFFANEKTFYVENGFAGTIRVTYARGEAVMFTEANYNLGSDWPYPDWLPDVFHDLLWLVPAMEQAKNYKPDRYKGLKERFDRLDTLFFNRYSRNSTSDLFIETDESLRGNNR